MSSLTFGSVCSGIEAASVAWHPLGWRAVWLAEIEPFPSAVLAHHYPSVPNLGDMTTIAARIRAGELPAPDVLTGGTPCQAFSVAGLRKGLTDARGQLTLSFVRIADAIDEQRAAAGLSPCTVVWENVPGVLSSTDNAFGCFIAALAGEDEPLEPLGGKWGNAGAVVGQRRTVAWRILDAQHFGVPQRRRRVWVVASAGDLDPVEVLFELEGVQRHFGSSQDAGQEAARAAGASTAGAAEVDAHLFNAEGSVGATLTASNIGKVLNNQTPLVVRGDTEGPDRAVGNFELWAFPETDNAPALTAQRAKDTLVYPLNLRDGTRDAEKMGSTENHRQSIGIGKEGDAAHTLTTACVHGVAVIGENALGVEPLPVTALSVHENQRAELTLHETTGAVQCRGGKPGQGYQSVLETQRYVVRRLTPRECERLQGFPDDWTLIPWKGKPATECPDGPRYKALGNSWAVPVARWVGSRIDALHGASTREAPR